MTSALVEGEEPLFHQRLHPVNGCHERRLIGPQELDRRERHPLWEVCLGSHSSEITACHGLAWRRKDANARAMAIRDTMDTLFSEGDPPRR